MTIFRCLAGAAAAAAVITAGAVFFAAADEPKRDTEARAETAAAAAARAEPAKSPIAGCISDSSNFKAEDKRAYFIVALENACEQRVTCEVFANIRTARGSKRGHGTLVLAAKSAGAEAKKAYRMRVKVAGGMAQVERQCKAY
jgi:hypothetical protein